MRFEDETTWRISEAEKIRYEIEKASADLVRVSRQYERALTVIRGGGLLTPDEISRIKRQIAWRRGKPEYESERNQLAAILEKDDDERTAE